MICRSKRAATVKLQNWKVVYPHKVFLVAHPLNPILCLILKSQAFGCQGECSADCESALVFGSIIKEYRVHTVITTQDSSVLYAQYCNQELCTFLVTLTDSLPSSLVKLRLTLQTIVHNNLNLSSLCFQIHRTWSNLDL